MYTARYQPTGVDRDSYVSGVRPGCRYAGSHDVSKRRDGLPSNVYAYIRCEAEREERQQQVELEKLAVNRNLVASGTGGKRMSGGTVGDMRGEAAFMLSREQVMDRMHRLRELYAREAIEWDSELALRGLAAQRASE